jgi:cell division protein FtsL
VRQLSAPLRAALAVAALLASLSLVAWRQSRALERLGELDGARKEMALALAEGAELRRRIQYLESYGRVVAAARERLGMHVPDASEQVLLAVEEAR